MKDTFYVIYMVGIGYRVVRKDGLIVCGKSFGKYIPFWNDRQARNCYCQLEEEGTKSDCIRYLKEQVMRQAANRDISKRRKNRSTVGRRIRGLSQQ